MKRLALKLMALAALGSLAFATGGQALAAEGKAKVIGYYMDASDDFYKAGFEVFKTLAGREGWTVLDVVGQGTAPEQIAAVENFITQGVDALLVVQNSPETTSQTLKLAKAAGIPEFHLTHNPPNEPGLAGFSGYDWVGIGVLAGKSAMQHNVKRVIMIEGKLGQGTAAGQTEGFLQGVQGRRQGHRQPRPECRRQGRRGQGPSGRVLGVGRMVRGSRQEGHAGCDHQPRAGRIRRRLRSKRRNDGRRLAGDAGSRPRSEQILARIEQRQGEVVGLGQEGHHHDGRE